VSYTYVKIITLGDLNYTARRIHRHRREKPSPRPRHQAYQGACPATRCTSPKWYTSPPPYRAYSLYPAEGKASFSWRKSAFT